MKMARKDRNIASFGDVANTNKNVDNNKDDSKNKDNNKNVVNNDNNNKNIIENNNNNNIDYIDNLISGNKKAEKENKKVFTQFYLEPDIYECIEGLIKKAGGKKGVKSRIANELFRNALKEKGLL